MSRALLLALVALSLFLNVKGFYFNKDSFAEAINKEFRQKHPLVVRNVQHMFPNIDRNRIFKLKKVSRLKVFPIVDDKLLNFRR